MARILVLVVLVTVCLATASAARRAATIGDAIDQYSRGEYDAAIQSAIEDAETASALTSGADAWIAAGDSSVRARRQMIAATFALDVSWAATRNYRNASALDRDWTIPRAEPQWRAWLDEQRLIDLESEFPIVLWACRLMPVSGAVTPAERSWWLASVGLLEDGRAWRALVGPPNDERKKYRQQDSPATREVFKGHLAHARARVPDEPRWRMAQVIAQSAIDHSTLQPALWSDRQPTDRPGVLRDMAPYERAEKAIPQAVRHFAALENDATLAGEAELHIGYLELRMRRWASALAHLEHARPLLTDPFLLGALDYFAGWADERLDRPADALASYRRANALTPRLRDLSTLLAAQLFLVNERAEAYAVLDAAVKRPETFDVVTMFEHGDARLVPVYLSRAREALR